MSYVPTIGLEIHAELKTKTKIFCDSPNDAFAAEANTNICPVCMAHPGTLPVINREAVRHVLRVGMALGGTLANYTEFDRKSYFYPDLPKGYQISQYEHPLVRGGELASVAITRVHLEEDTASSMHDDTTGATTVDYNRAGVPLMELVTEPVITSAKQAGDFARELQLLLRYLGASEANMEKGEMRVEANISVAQEGKRGTKVEIKNLNSFRIMERAVEYEITRQTKLLERGEVVTQETRGWDEGKQATFAQRIKEGSADYRYFPDPDLPSLLLSDISDLSPQSLALGLPELPAKRRDRYISLGLKPDDADMFVRHTGYGQLFDSVIEPWGRGDQRVVLAANFIANNISGSRDTNLRDSGFRAEMPMNPKNLSDLIDMLVDKKVTSPAAKEILADVLGSGKAPTVLAQERGLLRMEDEKSLEDIVSSVVSAHLGVVADYRGGKVAAMQFLVGQAMKIARGAADPTVLRALIEKNIAKTGE